MINKILFIDILAASVTPVVFILLANLFPYGKTAPIREITLEEMKVASKNLILYKLVSFFVLFTVCPLCIYLAYNFLTRLYRILFMAPSTLRFKFDEMYWVLPALALGIVMSFHPIELILKKVLGEAKFTLLNHITSQQYGFNGQKVLKVVAWILMPAGVIFCILGYNWYAYVSEDRLVFNRLMDFTEKQYAFTQIDSIVYIDKQVKFTNRTNYLPTYRIHFKDNLTWTTREGLRDMPVKEDSTIIHYISNKTGLRVDTVLQYEYR